MLLSDLLFLEGAMIFGVGAFVASGMTWLFTSLRYLRDRYHSKEKTSADIRKPPKKQITGIFMLIIGTSLIGLSIVISVLPI